MLPKARIDYVWIHKDTNLKLGKYAVLEPPEIPDQLAGKLEAVSDHLPVMATSIYEKEGK